eukprot:13084431-Ditylum_brightwellii.AAC.1
MCGTGNAGYLAKYSSGTTKGRSLRDVSTSWSALYKSSAVDSIVRIPLELVYTIGCISTMNGDSKILPRTVFPLTSTFSIASDTPPILKEIIGAISCINSNAISKNGCLTNTPIASISYFCLAVLTKAVPVQRWA